MSGIVEGRGGADRFGFSWTRPIWNRLSSFSLDSRLGFVWNSGANTTRTRASWQNRGDLARDKVDGNLILALLAGNPALYRRYDSITNK
jgi:hypothetical protein